MPISVVNGRTVCGFYAPHSHRIVPVGDCAIQQSKVKDVFRRLKNISNRAFKGYDEVGGKGDIRHFVARNLGGKFIFALVAVRRVDTAPLVKELKKRFEEFTLLLNINRGGSNVIFGTEWHTVVGSGFFGAEEHGIRYRAGANTFVQVNDEMREKLYSAVLAEAEEGTTAVDLYSGGGLLTAMLAKKCGKAYGIEAVKEASRCADELKCENGLQDKMFNVCGKVEDELESVLKKTEGRKMIVCDPPRKGMEKSVVNAVKNSSAEKIVLISCNPATLARDLGILTGTLTEKDGALVKCDTPVSDYEIEKITPFDMFPQTKHVETLVTLFHKKPDSHIEVTVDFENGKIKKDGIIERAESKKPKEKPTYKLIQKWVEATYGLKVHTAYIAEVKRDLGFLMYDAPNAVEELKRPRAHPTPKMVEAIKAALKHFEII